MALDPAYASIPNTGGATLTTADTSRTNPTNFVTFFTANAQNGSRVERISGIALGASVATLVRLWKWDPNASGAAAWHLLEEVQSPALTASTSEEAWNFTRETVTTPEKMPKVMPAGWQLRASCHATFTDGLHITAEGADF